jgi:SHS2 domain-containing protein
VALVNVMIKNIDAIQENESRSLHLCGDTMELLLFNFLQEIIYYKDAEKLLLVYYHLDIENTLKEWVLNCRAAGEDLDPLRHEQLVDVKAVTLHQFKVPQSDRGWSAFIILDI